MVKKKVRILCNGLIWKNNTFLLLKRCKEDVDFPGEWELPGGLIEFGENPSKGIAREIKEETGLNVQIIGMHKILSKFYKKPGKIIHLIRIIFLCKTDKKDVKINSKEHTDFKWIRKSEAKKLKLSNYLKEIL